MHEKREGTEGCRPGLCGGPIRRSTKDRPRGPQAQRWRVRGSGVGGELLRSSSGLPCRQRVRRAGMRLLAARPRAARGLRRRLLALAARAHGAGDRGRGSTFRLGSLATRAEEAPGWCCAMGARGVGGLLSCSGKPF